MADYIRKDLLLELAREYYSQGLKEEAVPVRAIKNIPSADVVDLDDLDKGSFYGVGTDGVFYKLYPRINLPLAKKINVETGEIIYPTNADRIRAMSDEELARKFAEIEKEPNRWIAIQSWLEWLKSEA